MTDYYTHWKPELLPQLRTGLAMLSIGVPVDRMASPVRTRASEKSADDSLAP